MNSNTLFKRKKFLKLYRMILIIGLGNFNFHINISQISFLVWSNQTNQKELIHLKIQRMRQKSITNFVVPFFLIFLLFCSLFFQLTLLFFFKFFLFRWRTINKTRRESTRKERERVVSRFSTSSTSTRIRSVVQLSWESLLFLMWSCIKIII